MAALCIFLLAACITDYLSTRIPNVLVVLILLSGLGYRAGKDGFAGGAAYLVTGLFILGILYPLFRLNTLGGGDVKLLSVTSGYLSGTAVLDFLFYSVAFAAIISVFKIIKERNGRERFLYLRSYILETVQKGEWKIYFTNDLEKRRAGICLAGPVLLSILLYLGGAY